MAKSKWSRTAPSKPGWYWVKYEGKHGTVVCPAEVDHFSGAVFVHTMRDRWILRGLPNDEKAYYGPEIPPP
jgi:hypothetical protein